MACISRTKDSLYFTPFEFDCFLVIDQSKPSTIYGLDSSLYFILLEENEIYSRNKKCIIVSYYLLYLFMKNKHKRAIETRGKQTKLK